MKKLRKEKALTVRDLSRRSGVAVGYISELERGKKGNPSLDALKKLAAALDVTPGELLE